MPNYHPLMYYAANLMLNGKPNGYTLRTFEFDGLELSEVEFEIEDVNPRAIGYMVGENDGYSTLYVTPERAVEVWRNQEKFQ